MAGLGLSPGVEPHPFDTCTRRARLFPGGTRAAPPPRQDTHHEHVLLRRLGRELRLALSDAQEHWAGADPWKRLPHFTDDPGSRNAAVRLWQEVPTVPCAAPRRAGFPFFFFFFPPLFNFDICLFRRS